MFSVVQEPQHPPYPFSRSVLALEIARKQAPTAMPPPRHPSMLRQTLKSAARTENLPYTILAVLAAMSLLSRLILISR
jgi:hypothetical protein